MRDPRKFIFILFFAGIFFVAAHAQNLNMIGVTLLRATTTNLNGSAIQVAQVEAGNDLSQQYTNWEVNPATVGKPSSLFTYISANGSTTNFPNSISSQSSHAGSVGNYFYGSSYGVATNAAHVDNFEANYFINSVVDPTPYLLSDIGDAVVNQSFTAGPLSTNDQETLDSAYDNYSDQFQTLFISAACNYSISHNVCAPGTAYNCISVGAYQGDSSIGPTLDNGRCKPDITAPGGATSFSTPQVAGAAVVLMQAALRGDGGSDTNSAADLRTVKALLLNGAVKSADWTNSNSSPLDARYGAGVLNVFNSYRQLACGKQSDIVSTVVSAGGAHPPTADTGTESSLSGWDFNTNTSSSFPSAQDGVKHYYFNVTNAAQASAIFTATATLVWNRQQNQSDINNLNLFLYNCADSNLVMCSTSLVDNVEHLFIPKLPSGRYDLQVWMSASGINAFNNSETYALAWEFSSQILSAAKSGTNLNLSWPVYPAGFAVESATNLASPVWRTNGISPPAMTNNENLLSIPETNAVRFFRLRTPNF